MGELWSPELALHARIEQLHDWMSKKLRVIGNKIARELILR
jgi:hypothetical protein